MRMPKLWLLVAGVVALVGASCGLDDVKGVGDPCEGSQECGAGLLCEASRCQALPDIGQPCPSFRCERGAYCVARDPSPTQASTECVEAEEVGHPCMGHRECATEYCPAAFCAERPGRGQPCRAGICAGDLTCADAVCQ